MANPTLLDIAKLNADDGVVPLIELSIQSNPEMRVISAMDIPGQGFDTVLRTSIPMGGFRNANEGKAAVKSSWANKRVNCLIMDAAVEVDKAVADSYVKGRDRYLTIEGAGVLEGQLRAAASQAYYGTQTAVATSQATSPTKGFPGLLEAYDSTNMVVDAAGSGSDCSSVWLLKFGETYVQWVVGMDGKIALGEVAEVRLTDGSGNPYDGYRRPCLAYMGLQIVNTNAMVRIKNIDSGKPLTDDMIYEALDKFPTGIVPDAIFMSRRSRRFLRESRTATNATGAPAPQPTEVEGVPIHVTDAIVDTETND